MMKKVGMYTSFLVATALAMTMATGALAESPKTPEKPQQGGAWMADYQARAADDTVNTAQEYLDVIREINEENYCNYVPPMGDANDMVAYLSELGKTKAEIKAQLLEEIQNPAEYPQGLIAQTGLTDGAVK